MSTSEPPIPAGNVDKGVDLLGRYARPNAPTAYATAVGEWLLEAKRTVGRVHVGQTGTRPDEQVERREPTRDRTLRGGMSALTCVLGKPMHSSRGRKPGIVV